MGFSGKLLRSQVSGCGVQGSGFRKSTQVDVMVFAIIAFQHTEIIE
jgi:hypothetical protein